MAKYNWEKRHTRPELTLEPIEPPDALDDPISRRAFANDWLDDEEALVECGECGTPFTPESPKQDTCSRTCQLVNPEI